MDINDALIDLRDCVVPFTQYMRNMSEYFPRVYYAEKPNQHDKRRHNIYAATFVRRFYEGQWYKVFLMHWITEPKVIPYEQAKIHLLHNMMVEAYKIHHLYIPQLNGFDEVDVLQIDESERLFELIKEKEL